MAEQTSFESALDELQKKVKKLEQGDLPLEEALTAFEEGVRLVRQCQEKIQAAEKRVEILTKVNADGQAETQKFES